MLEKMLAGFVVSFVLKQLDKLHDQIDWDKAREDLDAQVRALVPGSWFDEDAVRFVNVLFDACRKVLESDAVLKEILGLLFAQKFPEAAIKLKDLVMACLGLESLEAKAMAQL